MANSSGIYFADDISQPSICLPNSGLISDGFVASIATMLATTGATKFLLGDFIALRPMPPGAELVDYRVYVPALDTSTGVTLNLGDTQVLAGAVTAQSGTAAQTTPALGTTFTLTASASTAAFTSTNGLLMVGNGLIVTYASLSGSTFVGCLASSAGVVIAPGTGIQQIANTAAYQAAAVIGQSSAAGILRPDFNLTGTTFATSTVVLNALPAYYPAGYNTVNPALNNYPPTLGNVSPIFFGIQIAATTTTAASYTTAKIVGTVSYYLRGFQP